MESSCGWPERWIKDLIAPEYQMRSCRLSLSILLRNAESLYAYLPEPGQLAAFASAACFGYIWPIICLS
jgi:hypothetical protein